MSQDNPLIFWSFRQEYNQLPDANCVKRSMEIKLYEFSNKLSGVVMPSPVLWTWHNYTYQLVWHRQLVLQLELPGLSVCPGVQEYPYIQQTQTHMTCGHLRTGKWFSYRSISISSTCSFSLSFAFALSIAWAWPGVAAWSTVLPSSSRFTERSETIYIYTLIASLYCLSHSMHIVTVSF